MGGTCGLYGPNGGLRLSGPCTGIEGPDSNVFGRRIESTVAQFANVQTRATALSSDLASSLRGSFANASSARSACGDVATTNAAIIRTETQHEGAILIKTFVRVSTRRVYCKRSVRCHRMPGILASS